MAKVGHFASLQETKTILPKAAAAPQRTKSRMTAAEWTNKSCSVTKWVQWSILVYEQLISEIKETLIEEKIAAN